MEDLFNIDHVTISRIIIIISLYLSKIKVNIKDKNEDLFYIVDSTTLRIGKGKNKETYSGLKYYHLHSPTKRNEVKYKENKELSKSDNKNLSSKRIKVEHVFSYIKSFRIMQRVNLY